LLILAFTVVVPCLAIPATRAVILSDTRFRVLSVSLGSLTLLNWLLFVVLLLTGGIGGFGSHYNSARIALLMLYSSGPLFLASLACPVGRARLASAAFVMCLLWWGSTTVA
jgi:hypothetical protein